MVGCQVDTRVEMMDGQTVWMKAFQTAVWTVGRKVDTMVPYLD